MSLRVGIVGVGHMGLAMAGRLRDLGWPVAVHDIDAAALSSAVALGAMRCASAAALAARCDCAIVAVVDAAQIDAVLFGADGVLAAQALFERHRGLIEASSSNVFRLGERVGDGARSKLVNYLLAAVNLAEAAEAPALAERLGLDLPRTLAVIERSSGQSWIGSDRMRRALASDATPRAHTTLLNKDAHLALAAARAAGFDAPLGAAAAATFARACESGLGACDDASLLQLLRQAP